MKRMVFQVRFIICFDKQEWLKSNLMIEWIKFSWNDYLMNHTTRVQILFWNIKKSLLMKFKWLTIFWKMQRSAKYWQTISLSYPKKKKIFIKKDIRHNFSVLNSPRLGIGDGLHRKHLLGGSNRSKYYTFHL